MHILMQTYQDTFFHTLYCQIIPSDKTALDCCYLDILTMISNSQAHGYMYLYNNLRIKHRCAMFNASSDSRLTFSLMLCDNVDMKTGLEQTFVL